jgi:hypothetical protein
MIIALFLRVKYSNNGKFWNFMILFIVDNQLVIILFLFGIPFGIYLTSGRFYQVPSESFNEN